MMLSWSARSLLFPALVIAATPAYAQTEDSVTTEEAPTSEAPAEPDTGSTEAPGDTTPTGGSRTGGSTTTSGPTSDEVNYSLRLQELEDRVNELKEDIFRSKSRLFLLREQILRDAIGGSQAVLTHVNDLSGRFRMVEVVYSLDGNPIYTAQADDTDIEDEDRVEIFNGSVLPGPHNLSMSVQLEGNGFGMFSYMNGYRFAIRSSHAFMVDEGQTIEIDIVTFEQGGMNAPIEERPTVEFEVEVTDTVEEEGAEDGGTEENAGESE